MKSLKLFLIACFFSIKSLSSFAIVETDVVGVWNAYDSDDVNIARMEVVKKGHMYFARLAGSAQIVGRLMVDGEDTWEKGEYYDIKSGKKLKCRLEMQEDGSVELKAWKRFPIPFLTYKEVWRRVE